MNATASTTTRTRYYVRMNDVACTASYSVKGRAITEARRIVGIAKEANIGSVIDVTTAKGKTVWTFTVEAHTEYSNVRTDEAIIYTNTAGTVRAEWWHAQGALYLYVRENGAWVVRERHAFRVFTPSYLVWAEMENVARTV